MLLARVLRECFQLVPYIFLETHFPDLGRNGIVLHDLAEKCNLVVLVFIGEFDEREK